MDTTELKLEIDYDMDLAQLLEHAKVLEDAATADIWYEPQPGMYSDPDAKESEENANALIDNAQRSMDAVAQWIKTKWVQRFAEKWAKPTTLSAHPEGCMTDMEYARGGWSTCPRCKQAEVDAYGRMEVDGNEAWQMVECKACGFEYEDVFRLIGYREVEPLVEAVTQFDRDTALIAKMVKVIEDFMPNIGNCALQDYGRLNEALMESSQRLKEAQDG